MSKIQLKQAYLDYVDNGTAFNALADLCLSVEEGEYLIDNEPVDGPGKNRGIVFQRYSLFPWMTSRGNVS